MNSLRQCRALALLLSLWMLFLPLRGVAEDIDIFVGNNSTGSSGNPNVLIILDNTSNWARQNQQWPGGEQQGQSEAAAIKSVIAGLDGKINVGLMEFVTSGNANDNGGFVRYAIRPMDATNKAAFSTQLDTIYSSINSPDEKRNSNTPYGNLMADAYNYFAGGNQSQSGAGTLGTIADSAGYASNYGTFKSPLSCATDCAKNFIIFIGNPNASGPASDDAANTTLLTAAGGNASQLGLPNFTATTTVTPTDLGTSYQCYGSQSACSTALASSDGSDFNALGCSSYSGGCSCGTSVANATVNCASGTFSYTVTGNNLKLGRTSACYQDSSGAPKNYPSNSETTLCTSGTATFSNRQQGTCGNNKYTWEVTCNGSSSSLGNSNACYANASDCASAYSCPSGFSSCSCSSPSSQIVSCASGGTRYSVSGNTTSFTNTPTGTYTTDTNPFNADEWARHLYQNGVPISGCSRQTVTTYTLDVYNAQPNTQHTALMMSMAKVGGGKYFTAQNKAAIITNLTQIFREIQSVNSTFASASLPINATNRAQNENQVFIGTFRPDPDTKPRWFGNVKQYKLINSAGSIVLGDANGKAAINYNTGFVDECATSAWTTDSGTYWEGYPVNPSFGEGQCSSATKFSDLPDGARVEKGAVAEVLRKGNNPGGSATYAVNRTIYTASGTSLVAFNTTNSGLGSTLVNWVSGQDTENEDVDANLTETRASIHGDVVHSRPLPVNYCTTSNCSNVVAYYGANDGLLRAVDAATGREKWAFVAPEFFGKLDRLRAQSPLVAYPGMPSPTPTPTPVSRDYFFDGSIGIYQNADNSKVWIYPTMRRGGRMLYAFDVTNSDAPSIKWRFGCDAAGTCTTGASNIGQTWSIPNIAWIRNGEATQLALVMGGGYDTCEDADSSSPSCASPKGNQVYVLNAADGSVIRSFTTLRSVIADVAMIDMNGDGKPEYGYVGDTGGNLYRIAFSAFDSAGKTFSPLTADQWTITRIAYTSGGGRKFQFTPALYGGKGTTFIALGSGDREHPLSSNYPYTTPVQNRFYVYRDCVPNGTIAASSLNGGDSLDDTTKMSAYSATSPASCAAPQLNADCSSSNKGWYMNLNNGTGEQTVTSALIAAGMVTFSTNRPIPAVSGSNSCTTELGEARGYWLDLFRGSGAVGVNGTCGGVASGTFVGGGLPPSPVIGTVPVDGKPTTVIIGAIQKSGTASASIDAQKSTPTNLPARKRVYFTIKGDN